MTLCVHNTTAVPERARPRGRAAPLADLHPPGRARSPAGGSSRPLETPRRRDERQHLPRAGHRRRRRRARRGDRPARPSADRAREPRRPVRRTEIEEALLLHVHALRDEERAEIAAQDPAVREMIARAAAATPEDILAAAWPRDCADRSDRRPRAAAACATRRRRAPTRRSTASPSARRQGRAAPGPDARPLGPHARRAQRPRSSGSTATTTDKLYLGVTVDDDPGPGADARDRPLPVLLPRRGGGVARMTDADEADPRRGRRQRLAAATTASAARSARRLDERELPAGVSVMDFGTGGLDLAYEVMRGYDALVLVDVSRQGGEPGTLYVMEPERGTIAGRDRGRRDDRPARRWTRRPCCASSSRRRLAGEGRRDRVRAGRGRGDRARALRSRSRAPSSARSGSCSRRSRSCATERRTEGGVHELSLAQRDRRHRASSTPTGAG